MHTQTAVVGSAVGLHARPASIISQAAADCGSDVMIGLPGAAPVDASSSLMIMTLGAGNGAVVEVSGEVTADVEAIVALVEQDLDAEDAPGATV